MPRTLAAAACCLMLNACAGATAPPDPQVQAASARERSKLEDLAYCTVQAEGVGEPSLADDRFRAAVDRCMAGLGYSPAAASFSRGDGLASGD